MNFALFLIVSLEYPILNFNVPLNLKIPKNTSIKKQRSRKGGGGGGTEYRNGHSHYTAGSVPPPGAMTERHHFYDAATGAHGFQENTSWETKEHFERKVNRGQKRGGSASQLLSGAAGDGSRARIDQWSSNGRMEAIERGVRKKEGF
jgi:hypothetical protein